MPSSSEHRGAAGKGFSRPVERYGYRLLPPDVADATTGLSTADPLDGRAEAEAFERIARGVNDPFHDL